MNFLGGCMFQVLLLLLATCMDGASSFLAPPQNTIIRKTTTSSMWSPPRRRRQVQAVAAVSMEEDVAVVVVEPKTSTQTNNGNNGNHPRTPLPDDDHQHIIILQQQQPKTKDNTEPPTLGEIRKLLPKSVFQVSTKTSLAYFAVDMAAVIASMTFLHSVVVSDAYHQLPLPLQAVVVAPLQVLTGSAMWAVWCIGHDAGHATVSKHSMYGRHINRMVGELAHSVVCLTPFVPWQKSHLQHHLNHNHLTNDYSHQWFLREEAHHLDGWIQLSYQTRNMLQLPWLYLVYLLLGIPDGGHVYFYGRLWEQETIKEKQNAAISVVVSVVTATSLWASMGTADFVVVCLVPWLVLSVWLFMVTYLQHHSDDGRLYTDSTWTFVKGALETVDRDYGHFTNSLSHEMMSGHVVHHLFFTRVPHYHLKEATTALKQGLQEQDQVHWYKSEQTYNYLGEITRQFDENWFFCNESQVVRK
jgi:acyl-lipid omega-3 desaturase